MIARLQGKIAEVNADTVLIDVSGVGYELHCSPACLAELSQIRAGSIVELHTFFHVREDVQQLFGFLHKDEKQLFVQLCRVTGIGPRSALAILGGAAVAQIVSWIEEKNIAQLATLPKVGKKSAEQMVLTLRGKLPDILTQAGALAPLSPMGSVQSDLTSALVHMGFRPVEVEKVVRGLPGNLQFDEGLRQGLQVLTREQR